MGTSTRILVADDHPIVRAGLVAILGTQADFDVVGEAANGREVLQQVELVQPDLLLLDLEMPVMDGVQTLTLLRESVPRLPVLVFTAFDTDERILGAIRAGAQGYILKGMPREELFAAIRIVRGGGSLLQPLVAASLIRQVAMVASVPVQTLTPREHDVLRLLAHGLQNKEIARELRISARTVKFHVSSVFGKLGASNRTEAVARAAQQGLINIAGAYGN
ncbi:MAG: response regulator transcription factor [Herpetosiphon sp.]